MAVRTDCYDKRISLPREQQDIYIYISFFRSIMFSSKSERNTHEFQCCIKLVHDLYCSPSIVRVIKSIRMRWVRHVACMGEERGVYRVLVGKPE